MAVCETVRNIRRLTVLRVNNGCINNGTRFKRTIRGRDEAPRESNSFRLVAVEQGGVGSALDDGGDLPAKVHGIADAGIHALTAHGTMNVRGIAEQERPTGVEVVR